jgi:hypothetical protein
VAVSGTADTSDPGSMLSTGFVWRAVRRGCKGMPASAASAPCAWPARAGLDSTGIYPHCPIWSGAVRPRWHLANAPATGQAVQFGQDAPAPSSWRPSLPPLREDGAFSLPGSLRKRRTCGSASTTIR